MLDRHINKFFNFCKINDLIKAFFDQFKLENGKFGETISGRYDVNGTFTKEGTATLENQTLHAKGGVLYKVNYSSQQSLTSNTIENIGNNL